MGTRSVSHGHQQLAQDAHALVSRALDLGNFEIVLDSLGLELDLGLEFGPGLGFCLDACGNSSGSRHVLG